MNKVVINGELVAETEAKISLLDRNVQLGLSVFETLLAESGAIDGFDLHVARLKQGMERLSLSHSELDEESLKASVDSLLEANQLMTLNARVRITVTGEVLMVQATEAAEISDDCNVVISEHVLNERSAVAGIKCGSYASNIIALREHSADEVIFLNSVGEVAEGAISNVFLVSDGKLITPRLESGCLPGVTRALVIRRARAAGMDVQECAVLLEDLLDADEVFLTNSSFGVRSVNHLGEVRLDTDSVTQQVRKIYQDGDQ